MPASTAELVTRAFENPELAAVLSGGDWYLVGSRIRGFADELSDWDTMLLTPQEPTPAQRRATARAGLDRTFGIVRPDPTPDLAAHRASRRLGGVEIAIFGPDGRAHREHDGTTIFASDCALARPLRLSVGIGEDYRRAVAERFGRGCDQARDEAYEQFRKARNEAAATLAREDALAVAMTTALCARAAARFWLLARREPTPADKWLPGALAGEPILALLRDVADAGGGAAERYDLLWTLWRLIDARAVDVGVDPGLLAGSPFAARAR
ncbi:MAG TPA: hypothetical protein VGF84_16160 [Micromonosporaceae bacterium]